jgi:hypothetical protein
MMEVKEAKMRRNFVASSIAFICIVLPSTFLGGVNEKKNECAEVKQPRTNLRWCRCPLGQQWNGEACEGSQIELNWCNSFRWGDICDAVSVMIKSDEDICKEKLGDEYRLPTAEEYSILLEETGGLGSGGKSCNGNDGDNFCTGILGHDDGHYWSSSAEDGDKAWSADFERGYLLDNMLSKRVGVRCLRESTVFSEADLTDQEKTNIYKSVNSAEKANIERLLERYSKIPEKLLSKSGLEKPDRFLEVRPITAFELPNGEKRAVLLISRWNIEYFEAGIEACEKVLSKELTISEIGYWPIDFVDATAKIIISKKLSGGRWKKIRGEPFFKFRCYWDDKIINNYAIKTIEEWKKVKVFIHNGTIPGNTFEYALVDYNERREKWRRDFPLPGPMVSFEIKYTTGVKPGLYNGNTYTEWIVMRVGEHPGLAFHAKKRISRGNGWYMYDRNGEKGMTRGNRRLTDVNQDDYLDIVFQKSEMVCDDSTIVTNKLGRESDPKCEYGKPEKEVFLYLPDEKRWKSKKAGKDEYEECFDDICIAKKSEVKGINSYEVRQPGTDVFWLRCPIGQKWDGSSCKGEPQKVEKFSEAENLCPSSYRLPTIEEFVSLLGPCSEHNMSGTIDYCEGCNVVEICGKMFGADAGVYWSRYNGRYNGKSEEGPKFGFDGCCDYFSGLYEKASVRCLRRKDSG